MFSPPPSPPLPPPSQTKKEPLSDDFYFDVGDDSSAASAAASYFKPASMPDQEQKRMVGRRIRWAVVLVPLVLILITASTRLLTHPILFDYLSKPPSEEWPDGTEPSWELHERHAFRRAASVASAAGTTVSINFPTAPPSTTSQAAQSTTSSAQPLQTVPASPPVLPTPFPQPLDTSFQNNFSSASCYNFFVNMTNTLPFRACRPFSLLLQSSNAFIQAQTNITLLNSIIWGTCNTVPGETQCMANMAWFASQLQTVCAQDLGSQNAMAVNTLMGLQAYPLMFSTGCLVDPTTDAYCYISAVVNPNPSDIYFYSLPLGLSLPNSTKLSCSGCTKSILSLYEAALGNGAELVDLNGLRQTYPAAAQIAGSECGAGYAVTSVVSGAVSNLQVFWHGSTYFVRVLAVVLFGWSLLP